MPMKIENKLTCTPVYEVIDLKSKDIERAINMSFKGVNGYCRSRVAVHPETKVLTITILLDKGSQYVTRKFSQDVARIVLRDNRENNWTITDKFKEMLYQTFIRRDSNIKIAETKVGIVVYFDIEATICSLLGVTPKDILIYGWGRINKEESTVTIYKWGKPEGACQVNNRNDQYQQRPNQNQQYQQRPNQNQHNQQRPQNQQNPQGQQPANMIDNVNYNDRTNNPHYMYQRKQEEPNIEPDNDELINE